MGRIPRERAGPHRCPLLAGGGDGEMAQAARPGSNRPSKVPWARTGQSSRRSRLHGEPTSWRGSVHSSWRFNSTYSDLFAATKNPKSCSYSGLAP